ncbi:MAG: excinuclease ABC subunit UvrC [Anaerovoracaceae bacterium]
MFDIKENLKNLPDLPGVYLHKDKVGHIIYVGKAISLKNRVRQYFQSSKNMDNKVRAMVGQIEEFDYIITGSEMEALILECTLIKRHMPKYNVLLRDDKTYPYIRVTTEELYPRIIKTRIVGKEGSKYFGPYSDAGAVNQIVELLNQVYALKKCASKNFPKEFKPCLNFHINQCDGICQGTVDPGEYRRRVNLAMEFLRGKSKEITQFLQDKMEKSSHQLDFETAAQYRDYLAAAEALMDKQRVVLQDRKDVDLILTATGKNRRHIVLFSLREGKLSGRETYDLQYMEEDTSQALIVAFIKQHYSDGLTFPKEIILEKQPEERELLEDYLASLAGHQVKLLVPQKGEKREILQMAKKDVIEMVKTIDEKQKVKQERTRDIGKHIHSILERIEGSRGEYNGRTYRVEAYDISNTNGVDTVGAMVVFEGLKPEKKSYRRFKVKTIEGSNDYASMQEVLFRRFKRAEEGDQGFGIYPDLILLDGGKGHVTAAMEILNEMELNLPVAGMVKDDHHRTRALVFLQNGESTEMAIKEVPLLYQYLGRIQEEVHRFAIEYHRGVRNKRMLTSILDEIDGIGPAKRNALLDHFGSVDKIKVATVEQLHEAKGITPKLAGKIREYFHC